MNEFVIRGARGTMPACGPQYCRYGGNTTCFSLKTDDGIIIIDAGTGLINVQNDLLSDTDAVPITMLFTHLHMDHIIGLPCFEPLYRKSSRIIIMADPNRPDDWKQTLKTFVGKPFWPVGLGESSASMRLDDLPATGSLDLYGSTVSWYSVPHPQHCVSYRIKMPHSTVVVATDVEYETGEVDLNFLNFCKGADHLVFDAQYRPEEYERHRGWGHSTWETAVEIAERAGVGNLVLTHHDPIRSDGDIDAIEDAARQKFGNTACARQNMKLG